MAPLPGGFTAQVREYVVRCNLSTAAAASSIVDSSNYKARPWRSSIKPQAAGVGRGFQPLRSHAPKRPFRPRTSLTQDLIDQSWRLTERFGCLRQAPSSHNTALPACPRPLRRSPQRLSPRPSPWKNGGSCGLKNSRAQGSAATRVNGDIIFSGSSAGSTQSAHGELRTDGAPPT